MEKIKVHKLGGSFFKTETIKLFFQKFFENNGKGKILFVFSAMKGITRLLRLIFIVKTEIKIDDELKNLMISLSRDEFKKSHLELISALFNDESKEKAVKDFENIFANFEQCLASFEGGDKTKEDKFYATLLQFGELASSNILNNYLNSLGRQSMYFDARDYVASDDNYREAKIIEIKSDFEKLFIESNILLTQGFIARNGQGENSVVGFDGSDYSATRFANVLAKNEIVSLTFWKDVAGVYTKNPGKFVDAELISEMTRDEYIKNVEKNNSFVIRPDSIRDLDEKIEVEIRSFTDLENPGTKINAKRP